MALGLPRDVAGSVYGLFNSYKNRNKAIRDEYENTSLLSTYYNELATNRINTLTARNKFNTAWNSKSIHNRTATATATVLTKMFYLIDGIELPNLTIGDSDRIDDGRGPYQTHSNSITTTTGNTFNIVYRETQQALIEAIILNWMNDNAKPFVRPMDLIFSVNYRHDLDGSTKVLTYTMDGVRPQRIKTIDAKHDGIKILLRDVTFIFNTIKVDVESGKPRKPKSNVLPRRNKFVDVAERLTGVAEDVLVKVDNIEKVVDNL